MASKTKKQVRENIEAFFRFQCGCLFRRPEYEKAREEYIKLEKEEDAIFDKIHSSSNDEKTQEHYLLKNQERLDKMNAILRQYYTSFMPNPNNPEAWKELYAYNQAVVKEFKPGQWAFAKGTGKSAKNFKVDIWRDKKIILHELSEWIDKEKQRELKKDKKGENFDKSPHLDKVDRYFAVFDLRNKKPPLEYRKIILKLRQFYPLGENLKTADSNKIISKVIDQARHDFQVAFKSIYKIPYKKFDKDNLKKSDFTMCDNCSERKVCKELCAEMERFLSEGDVKQGHRVGTKDVSEWTNI